LGIFRAQSWLTRPKPQKNVQILPRSKNFDLDPSLALSTKLEKKPEKKPEKNEFGLEKIEKVGEAN